jgi:hypothetical protein
MTPSVVNIAKNREVFGFWRQINFTVLRLIDKFAQTSEKRK